MGTKFNWRTTTWKEEYRYWKKGNKKLYLQCICMCWVVKYVCRWNLRSGASESCWCISMARRKNNWTYSHRKTHWMSNNKLYRVFTWIRTRCNNKKVSDYQYYWGRWIKCLWHTFEDFYRDMGLTYKSWLTIERIDVNWDYCKDNCIRITRDKQMRNRTDNVFVEYSWIKQTLIAWSEQTGINYHTLHKRYHKGWTGKDLFHKWKLTWQKRFYKK